jgi:glycosyltransferase involved in cell wall biosynthesis
MAAFNAEAYVRAALLSALAQRRPGLGLEVFVVNEGSTDHTAEVVRAVAATHAGVHLIENSNQGPAAARNVALEALPNSIDLVSFLDADDLLPPDRYEHDLALFAADTAALCREFARALLFSMRRRRANGLPPPPPEVFAKGGLQEAHGW